MDVNVSQTLLAFIDTVISRRKIPINVYARSHRNIRPTLNIFLIKQYVEEAINKMERKRIQKVYLFGSYSRGEQTPDSDVDLYIETDDDFSYFDQGEFVENFKDLTSKEVDVILNGAVPEFLNSNLRKDMICLYER